MTYSKALQTLIDLGKTLPSMDEALKTDATLVKGCTSRVWMADQTDGDLYQFTADSDAHIVRGLIAILMTAYNHVPVADIPNIDVDSAFAEMGLDQNLSPNRRNGFWSMVERVRRAA